MFKSDNKRIVQDNLTQQEYNQQNIPQIQEDSMYYMPEKFLKPEENKKGGGTLLKIGIGFLVIAVLSVAGFAVYVLKFKSQDDPENQNQKVLNLPVDPIPENKTDDTDILKTLEGRDKKRIQDINSIISALSMYFAENNTYPESLSYLFGKLSEVPVSPQGTENYSYQVSLDFKDYKLTFSLEGVTQNGSLILQPGKYQVRANNIIEIYKEDVDIIEDDIDDIDDNDEDNFINLNTNTGILPIPPKGPDTDNDGLTNAEEFLFGTDIDNPDSDGDGYLDGDEVANLYDPKNEDAKLADNINIVRVFYNETQGYSVLYPSKWMVETNSPDYKQSFFYDDKNGDFFTITVYANPQELNIRSWYLSSAPGVNPQDLTTFKAKTIDGISTKDGLNIYFTGGNKVYALSYFIKNETELNYYTTFLMFARSFNVIQ